MSKKHWFVWITLIFMVVSLGCSAIETLTPSPPLVAPPATSGPPATAPGALTDLQSQVEAVYQQAGYSVVNITVRMQGVNLWRMPYEQEGSGSGFVYDRDGHIVTNYHVVEGANSIMVTFADGVVLDATLVGVDSTNDLAVIRVDPEGHAMTPVTLTDSSALRVGQFVVAIGNPFGLEQTLTFGVISSLGRIIESPDGRYIGEAIQTDAAINPGNSGGPLLDLEGRVIGVNAQIISSSQSNAGIGFAIPANTVQRVVPELIANGRYPHPWMGVYLADLTPQLVEVMRNEGLTVSDQGVLITGVERGSPAEIAGLRAAQTITGSGGERLPADGDIIVGIDGTSIADFRELIVYLETSTRVGQTVQMHVLRGTEEIEVSLTLGERPQ